MPYREPSRPEFRALPAAPLGLHPAFERKRVRGIVVFAILAGLCLAATLYWPARRFSVVDRDRDAWARGRPAVSHKIETYQASGHWFATTFKVGVSYVAHDGNVYRARHEIESSEDPYDPESLAVRYDPEHPSRSVISWAVEMRQGRRVAAIYWIVFGLGWVLLFVGAALSVSVGLRRARVTAREGREVVLDVVKLTRGGRGGVSVHYRGRGADAGIEGTAALGDASPMFVGDDHKRVLALVVPGRRRALIVEADFMPLAIRDEKAAREQIDRLASELAKDEPAPEEMPTLAALGLGPGRAGHRYPVPGKLLVASRRRLGRSLAWTIFLGVPAACLVGATVVAAGRGDGNLTPFAILTAMAVGAYLWLVGTELWTVVVATDEAIAVRGRRWKTIRWDDVEAVHLSLDAKRRAEAWVTAGDRTITWNSRHRKWDKLAAIASTMTTPRIVAAARDRLEHGQPVGFGAITVTPTGLAFVDAAEVPFARLAELTYIGVDVLGAFEKGGKSAAAATLAHKVANIQALAKLLPHLAPTIVIQADPVWK